MVFKRRDKRPIWKIVAEFFYPRGGWLRAAQYVRHRLHRLPDPPHRIARGIWAGVFVCFTPFFGMHFFAAALIALIMQGNILAALLATFFGNPFTFVPISIFSLKFGHWLLGTEFEQDGHSVGHKFTEAGHDLWHNFMANWTDQTAEWHALSIFWDEVFYPYLIGGIIPGVVTASICYYITVPVIRAYQNRRRGRLKAKLEAIKQKRAAAKGDSPKE